MIGVIDNWQVVHFPFNSACKGTVAHTLSAHAYDVLTNKDLDNVKVSWRVLYPRPTPSYGHNITNSRGLADLTTLYPCKYILAWIRATRASYYPFDFFFMRNIEVIKTLSIRIPMSPFLKVGRQFLEQYPQLHTTKMKPLNLVVCWKWVCPLSKGKSDFPLECGKACLWGP